MNEENFHSALSSSSELIEMDFSVVTKKMNKAVKKVGTSTGSATKLSKADKMDWIGVFETKKAEAQTLKTEIDKTDKKIDQMVYELHALSEEETAIVENSNNIQRLLKTPVCEKFGIAKVQNLLEDDSFKSSKPYLFEYKTGQIIRF